MLLPSDRIIAALRRLVGGPARAGATRERPAGRGAERFARFVALLGALVCVVFVAGLRDVLLSSIVRPAAVVVVPPPPGEAELEVYVNDAEGRAFAGAVVRIFTLDEKGAVFFASERTTRADGEPLAWSGLPEGEVWIVAYGEGRARASTRVILSNKARRTVTLALRPAAALTVHVVDAAGVVVPGAMIEVTSTDSLPHIVFTDDEGIAVLDRLGPAPWNVEISAEGYDTISRTGVYPEDHPLEIRLEKLGGFDVHVVDSRGDPVPFAEVLLSGPGIWPARSTHTDETGHAVIVGLYGGLYDLKARAGDLVSPTELGARLPHGELVEKKLVLYDGRFITVEVTDGPMRADGLVPLPVPNARVVLVEDGLSSFPLEGTTNVEGLVVLGPVLATELAVSVRAEGFVPRAARPEDFDDDKVTVALLRGATLFGDVRDDRGFPVDGATIEVIGTDIDGMPIHEVADRSVFTDDLFSFSLAGPVALIPRGELGVMPGPIPPIPHAGMLGDEADPTVGAAEAIPWVSDAYGEYKATPVTPGRVQLLVRHPEYTDFASEEIALAPGGEVRVDVVLRRGGRIEGYVEEEDGLPVEGARLELAAESGLWTQVTYTDADGSFAVASVPESVHLSVSRPDALGEVAVRLELDVAPGETQRLRIVLPKAREGTTIRFDDEHGQPLARVEARVQSLDLETVFARTFFSGEDGTIQVPGVRGLPLRVIAERPGKAPLFDTLDPVGEEHRLVLRDGLTLKGSLTGRGGRVKIEHASLSLYTLAGLEFAKSDEEGEFEFEDLAPGRARLVIRADGYAEDARLIDIAGEPLRPIELERIDLFPSGSIEGMVLDASGHGVAGARVGWGSVPTYLPVGRLPFGLAQTDADGRYALANLPEGTIQIEAYSAELGRGVLENVEVRADRVTRRVDITIPDQDYAPRPLKAAGSLAVTLRENAGAVVVLDVPENGEAEHAGIEPNDRLVSVAGLEVTTIEAARDLLSGPLTEDVIVVVERDFLDHVGRIKLRVRREAVRR
ncbi:MAG: carboxypeptidase regulatory-like domain-containing protein [Polyangiaceae bacterium]